MKRAGLERRRWVEPIDDFIREHGQRTPRWALLLTYQVDLDRFARSVLPVLSRRGRCFRTVLLADHGTLEQSLHARVYLPGACNIHPVRCRRAGVFHPKLVFLRAGPRVRVCFGSANLTDGGLGSNLEMWTSSDSAEIAAGVQHFLGALLRSPHVALDEAARRSLARALCGLSGATSDAVWSSLDESFASRLKSSAERNTQRVTILSPMCAGENGLKVARAAIPAKQVALYTDVNVALPRTVVRTYSPDAFAEEEADRFPAKLHAKACVFHSPRGDAAAWVGSANFTAQAFTKSLAAGGNVELMIRTILPAEEVSALERDLDEQFEDEAKTSAPPPKPEPLPRARATILSGELSETPRGLRLIVHSVEREGRVVLMHEKRCARVAIKKGRGVIEAKALGKFLPAFDPAAASTLVIHQRVGRQLFPVIVNVPHVPPEDGATAQASLDAFLDELRGRVRLPRAPGDEAEIDENDEDETEPDEIERRLDEVRHQGDLDQLAVKAVALKRLIADCGCEAMLGDALRVLLKATPRHLAGAIRDLFARKR